MSNTRKISQYNQEMNKILKESIRDAILLLLKSKKFNDITVSEICSKAGISRTGFYRNYKDKRDIIDELSFQLLKDAQEKVDNMTQHKIDPYFWYLDYFTFLEENRFKIQLLKEAGFQAINLDRTTDALIKHAGVVDEEQKAKIIIFNGALHNIALHWLAQEKRTPIEEISKWCTKYLVMY